MVGDLAIFTQGLTRYFDKRPVVRDLDLAIPRGSITGLLGLNGAGKSNRIACHFGNFLYSYPVGNRQESHGSQRLGCYGGCRSCFCHDIFCCHAP